MTDHADPAGRSPGRPPVRVRFAPSPSGDLHVGNIRTALFDWAFARHTGGVFVLRIEDTDQSRVLPAYIESALDTLRWLGLDWDEGPEAGGPYGPYLQSERLGIYSDWVVKFLESGHAYYCYCTTEEVAARRAAARAGGSGPSGYDGRCRNLTPDQIAAYQEEGRRPVVRLRMPDGATTFTDLVRGEITIENEHVPDFVLQRADGSPLYTLAVAVDDVLMKMTHIVRGDDLLSSTPRQLAVYRAMGVPESEFPVFAHLPFVLGLEGEKLGKRYGAASISYYRDEGFLPEAICNYLALLGWSPGDNRESFTLAEMAAEFDLARVNKNAARFDVRKLESINGDKIRELEPAEFVRRITPFLQRAGLVGDPPSAAQAAVVDAAAPLIQGRIVQAHRGTRHAGVPAGGRGRVRCRPGGRRQVTRPRRGTRAAGRARRAGRARVVDGRGHPGRAAGGAGRRDGAEAQGGVRRGAAGRDHRAARRAAPVRVDRAARPGPHPRAAGPGRPGLTPRTIHDRGGSARLMISF